MSHSLRIKTAQATLEPNQALFLSDPLDIFYLSDFICLTPEEREAFLFLTKDTAHIFLSSFSTPPQIDGLTVHVGGVDRLLKELLPNICEQTAVNLIMLDGNSLRLNEYEFLKSILIADITIENAQEPPLQQQRMLKDNMEIEYISQANHLTHQALDITFRHIKTGMTELEVQAIFEQQIKKMEVKEFAFPTIVAFGSHSALPHHQPTNTQLTNNTAILIDCGAKWHGYCADVTRTTWFGDTPDPEFTKIEQIVKKAYELAIAGLNQPTPKALTIDKLARDYITAEGFGSKFIHTTGHGVGLYIHEQPSLNPRNERTLEQNMVITVEPGIYLEGKFGYRFENSILLTKNSFQELL